MCRLHGWAGESEDRRRKELSMNLYTLDMMNKGGIHDHISKVNIAVLEYILTGFYRFFVYPEQLYKLISWAWIWSDTFHLSLHKTYIYMLFGFVSDMNNTIYEWNVSCLMSIEQFQYKYNILLMKFVGICEILHGSEMACTTLWENAVWSGEAYNY